MCKAGFAGDDAPRAVFRKLSLLDKSSSQIMGSQSLQRPLSADRATTGRSRISDSSRCGLRF
jgi:hypothetical protein